MKKKILLAFLGLFIIIAVTLSPSLFSHSVGDELVGVAPTEAELLYEELKSKNYDDFTSKWYKLTDTYVTIWAIPSDCIAVPAWGGDSPF